MTPKMTGILLFKTSLVSSVKLLYSFMVAPGQPSSEFLVNSFPQENLGHECLMPLDKTSAESCVLTTQASSQDFSVT